MTHQGTVYKRHLSNLNQYVSTLNNITLNTATQDVLDGKRVSDINLSDLLLEIKTKKAMVLPGFQDYLKAGINLTSQVPDCPVTTTCLTQVVEQINGWKNSNSLQYISYDKSKGFYINADGEAMLNRSVVTLNKKQVALYQQVKDLFSMMVNGGMLNYNMKTILSENVVGFSGKSFLEDDLIDVIAKTKFD